MSSEFLRTPIYTRADIENAIAEYFEVHTEEIDDNRPTHQQLIKETAGLLNTYINGGADDSKFAFRYIAGCIIELNNKEDYLKRTMLMLKQLNEAYNQLASRCNLNDYH